MQHRSATNIIASGTYPLFLNRTVLDGQGHCIAAAPRRELVPQPPSSSQLFATT